MPIANYQLIKRFDDRHELIDSQRSATDQATVYVRFSKQFLSVACVTAATVKDRAVIGNFLTIFSSQSSTDMSVNFFCLVGCSGFTCTDSPNRFVKAERS